MLNTKTNKLKNKKILLVCKERTSFTMYFLGKQLEKNNNIVHYYFAHHADVFVKNNFNEGTYYYFKENINIEKLHHVKDIYVKFINNRKNIKINFERLEEIKKKYTFFKSLNKQLLSSQFISTAYHDLPFVPTTYEENLYWLTLNYDKAEQLIEEIKPDCIIHTESGEIQSTIINEIAHHKQLPYINLEDSRYKNFILPTFSLGLHVDKYFADAYNRNRNDVDEHYLREVEKYRNQSKIMPEIYIGHSASSYDFSFWDAIKVILFKTYKFIGYRIYSIKQKKLNVPFNTPLNQHALKKILWNYFMAIRKFYLYSKFNKYFQVPEDEKYVYYPMHYIPESSTYVKAPMYMNEMSLIEAISKSLPIDWKLYVKEHQSMIGQRSLDFYKQVKKLHNVKIVKINFYKDPKPWIEKSECVVTITGTAGFEAAMLNKPAIVFGNVFYNVIPGIKIANSFNDLEPLFKLIETNNWNKDSKMDCAAYLKTVEEFGVGLSPRDLKVLSQKKIMSKNLDMNEEKQLEDFVDRLKTFCEKSFNIYDNSK